MTVHDALPYDVYADAQGKLCVTLRWNVLRNLK